MKTLQPFIDKDDMEFDKAAESALGKQKLIPNKLDDDKEAEEVEASVGYTELAM